MIDIEIVRGMRFGIRIRIKGFINGLIVILALALISIYVIRCTHALFVSCLLILIVTRCFRIFHML